MYFDGAVHCEGAGAGVVFITPNGEVLPYSFTLTQCCSNNVTEYQALILGLEMVLHPTVASWPFEAWGLDVARPLMKSSDGHLYILAATDYFSKWVEAVSLKKVKKENVANFIRVNIIYHFGIPRYLLTDNGKPLDNKLMTKIYDFFGFKQRNSSMYYAAANGLAEAFNKTLCNLLKKVVSKSKRD
ncbi:uncharacterized protein LOC107868742 [Capsicum annuum]|uniref:uncharacterized protein LOC107868742 n=1 Tax=Capsicum annuum TaxID=4072 RepID=UPI0007BFC228|nr:uncharacterized protein LOC107868742 [Capsicum annuum]